MQRRSKPLVLLFSMLLINALCFANSARAQKRFSSGEMPEPRFSDPERAKKLAAAFPEIEKLFNAYVERQKMPGAIIGIIIDGELVWVKTAGVKDPESKAPVTQDTVFRIASMTKSFTAMAILKLRDEGRLSLDDPAARFVPALEMLAYPTKDSPAITIRHLLTHSEGFPEDNPWGDRQLAQTNETMDAWMRAGIPFSNAPGTAYEYSNYGFAILGRIVEKASGRPYADYVRDEILRPLGMNSSTFEAAENPRERIALGSRWEDEKWKPEMPLAHGSFGAMGGLWTSARDLSRYVAFLMSAFPPRDANDTRPIKRSSAREMQQAWRGQGASAFRTSVDAGLQLSASSYGYGLGVSQDCRFSHVVGHGGGLPGYGSLMRWLPEHGVGMIAMSNLTYGGFGTLFNDAFVALHKTGALQPRAVQPSPALLTAQKDVSQLIVKWDEALASGIVADNFFMDESVERTSKNLGELNKRHGACRAVDSTLKPENALRGGWRMACERGWLEVFITLAPTTHPTVQHLSIRSVMPPDAQMSKTADAVLKLMSDWDVRGAEAIAGAGLDVERLRRLTGAAKQWGACRLDEAAGGDGMLNTTFKLACENGNLFARLRLDSSTRKLVGFELLPTREQRWVP